MGKTKTVVVDAEAVKKAMEWAGQSALDSCDEEADELYELSAALTPIVPTLPEGWRVVVAHENRVSVCNDATGEDILVTPGDDGFPLCSGSTTESDGISNADAMLAAILLFRSFQ